MLRFSYWVVAVGQVPSAGTRLTGRLSPLPAIRVAVTLRTKSGAVSGTTGGRSRLLVTCPGTWTSRSPSRVASIAA